MLTGLVSILYKSIAGRYRPVRVADGPITARYRFIKNTSWITIRFVTSVYHYPTIYLHPEEYIVLRFRSSVRICPSVALVDICVRHLRHYITIRPVDGFNLCLRTSKILLAFTAYVLHKIEGQVHGRNPDTVYDGAGPGE